MSSSLSELSTVGAQNGHAYDAIKGRPELSSVSADVLKHAQHHYNPGRDVVTRQENIPEGQFKARVVTANCAALFDPDPTLEPTPHHPSPICNFSTRSQSAAVTLANTPKCDRRCEPPYAANKRSHAHHVVLRQAVLILVGVAEFVGLFLLIFELSLKLKTVRCCGAYQREPSLRRSL